jgi:hypothetical protein
VTQIIGLCGDMGAGKDTTAQVIREVFRDMEQSGHLSPITIKNYAFASALKQSALSLFQTLNPQSLDAAKLDSGKTISLRNDVGEVLESMTVRTFLQRYGTEAHRDVFGDNVWVDLLMKTISEDPPALAIITDVRFWNEAIAIREHGGLIWRVVSDRSYQTSEKSHASESGIPDNLVDRVINNDRNPLGRDMLSLYAEVIRHIDDSGVFRDTHKMSRNRYQALRGIG